MIILYHLNSPNKIIKSFDNDEEMINFCKIKYKITADDLNAVEKFSYENPQFPYGIQRYYTYSNYCTICDEYGICDMITHFEIDHHLLNKHKVICEELDLKGRVLISQEGINGTIEGTTENTSKYIETLIEDDFFRDINFKKSNSDGKTFPKMQIKNRAEIVTTGLPYRSEERRVGKEC